MAEYKRKKVKKIVAKPPKHSAPKPAKRKTTAAKQDKIDMKPSRKAVKPLKPKTSVSNRSVKKSSNNSRIQNKNSGFRFNVIKGFKKKHTIKSAVVGGLSVALIIILIVLNFCVPVNILEATGNLTASIGYSNNYSSSLSGSSVLDVRVSNNITYVLSDTHVDIFNRSGKLIRSLQHGCASPALRITSGRSIVYDIGGTDYLVFNLYKSYLTGKTDEEIIAADISRSGVIAISTKSQRYTSEVEVLDRFGDSKYVWYCSEGVVSDLCLSANGNRLAVSVQSTVNGMISTNVNVLKYDSATPIFKTTYSDSFYSLTAVSNSKFSALAANTFDLCNYRNNKSIRSLFSHPVSMLREDYADYSIMVSHLTANKSENTVTIINKIGHKVCEFEYNGVVRDVVYSSGHIFILGDSKISKINTSGKTVSTVSCSFSALRLAPISSSKVYLISDTLLERVEF